jgi:hypothetical protein
MRTLTIVWQRLVDASGRTCPRCEGTGQAVGHAVERLRAALVPLGIEPSLETREIARETFKVKPLESNRIWIDGEPLEAWLNATPGASRCCDACGDAECRTLEVAGTTFEAIPESLLVRAGLIAASRLLDPTLQSGPSCG